MKKILISIPIILFSIAGFAQNTLNIHQKDGEKFCCGFLDKPIITYEGNTLKVSTKNVSIEFPLTELDKLSFEDGLADIKLQNIERESSDILIYNEKGILLKKIHNDSGISETNILEFPKGIFIIKKGNTTFKVLKR